MCTILFVIHQSSGDSLKQASPEAHDASQRNKISSQDNTNKEETTSQVGTATNAQKLPNAHAHPISHPEECSHALARIGLVADEVGPKKLKTGENQQP